MIRNITTAVIIFTALVSMASLTQIANAIEPDLNFDISIYEDNSLTSSHPYAWTPDLSQRERIIKLYEKLVLPNSAQSSSFSGSNSSANSGQRLFSFEVYQGDGLDDLREEATHYNRLLLPDEDDEAYEVSVKQRF